MSAGRARPAAAATTGAGSGAPAHWSGLADRRIFFGHQSVGRDIMGGMRALLAEHSGTPLRVVETDRPDLTDGPAFMEARIGRNREPRSKLEAFERIVASGLGAGGIALLKFCYVDVGNDTDVDALYDDYRESIARLEAAVPRIEVVHATIPLRTAPPRWKELAGRLAGRVQASEVNRRRERFNERLRAEVPGEKIFDIARIEATRADGSTATRRVGRESVPMLAEEWTTDGGHLNEAGARTAARALLDVLTRVASPESDISTGGRDERALTGRQ